MIMDVDFNETNSTFSVEMSEGGGSGGAPGEDGFSPIATVTQTKDGAVIEITDANGTTTATVKNGKDGVDGINGTNGVNGKDGINGTNGSDGKDGYTPVKGKDYWTESDKTEIVGEVAGAIDVSGKEDKANKVDDVFSNGSNREAYPSTKAVYDFGYAVSLDAANQAKQELIDFQLTPLSNRVKDVEEQVQGKANQSDLEAFANDLNNRKADKTDVESLQADVSNLESRTPILIKKVVVAEDVNSVTITTDKEGNPFSLTDFEIRFTGNHSTTMWLQLGKGEKYFSTNQVANNAGLPIFKTVADCFLENVVVHYLYNGSNFYGTRSRQGIGALGADGKYAAGAGDITPFNTTLVNSPASTIVVTAISGGVINAGAVIEIWGY